MKRLSKNLESTTPLVNDDFNNILQEQHRIAYSAYLDGINDEKYATYSTNRGIILNGIEIDATPTSFGSDEDKVIQFLNRKFDYQIRIDRNALIYFDGEYYSPDDSLKDPNQDILTYQLDIKDVTCLYFYPKTYSIIDQTNNIFQKRSYLRNEVGPTGPGSEGTQSVIIDNRFLVDYLSFNSIYDDERERIKEDLLNFGFFYPKTINGGVTLTPTAQSVMARYRFTIYPDIPYVLIIYGGTSRNLKRLVRLASTSKDDILINYDLKKWISSQPQIPTSVTSYLTSLGHGYSGYSTDDYIYRDFMYKQNNRIVGPDSYTEIKTEFTRGINELKGFHGLTAMSGRFPVGYDSSSSQNPKSAGLLQINYGLPENIGGTISLTFSSNQLPAHNHGGVTLKTLADLNHSHPFGGSQKKSTNTNDYNNTTAQPYGYLAWADPDGTSDPETSKIFLTRSNPRANNYAVGTNLDHRHKIKPVGEDVPHENRPPYLVTLYYYKL